MQEEEQLRQSLRELVGLSPQAGPDVERRLRVAFREQRRWRELKWLTVAAAAIFLAIALGWVLRQRTPAKPPLQAHTAGFVLLPYGQSDAPLEDAVVVRVRLESDAGPVDADLLVGQDGLARAVRYEAVSQR